MFFRWIPWRFILRRAARSEGLLDPILLLSRLARFGRLAEIGTPGGLLRAGALLHARGLINNQAIQHNLDWVWPHWVERQFDPESSSFIPRAFSLTHINLTHRNWTAVGYPGCPETPIVDPAGLFTPLFDGWSLDAWVVAYDGEVLVPSRSPHLEQRLDWQAGQGNLRIITTARQGDLRLESSVRVDGHEESDCGRAGNGTPEDSSTGSTRGGPRAVVLYEAASERPAWLGISFRPYNPEGVSFVHSLEAEEGGRSWRINRSDRVCFSEAPQRLLLSRYAEGDVYSRVLSPDDGAQPPATDPDAPVSENDGTSEERDRFFGADMLRLPEDPVHGLEVSCPVGMATGVALFRLPTGSRGVEVVIPLGSRSVRGIVAPAPKRLHRPRADRPESPRPAEAADRLWSRALETVCRLEVPDERERYLYETAIRTLLVHTPGQSVPGGRSEVFAGPYTYKRCWIRDTVMILNALLSLNLVDEVWRLLPALFDRQKRSGYFFSHDGEWDANGEVLWLLDRLRLLGGRPVPEDWKKPVRRAANWIVSKRLPEGGTEPHAGLLPPGFSAEHFGPNDYYYWDDFWCAAGLDAAARLARALDVRKDAERYAAQARSLHEAVDRSLETVQARLGRAIMPASPYRRMDSGSVGSLAGGYPLQLLQPRDLRLLNTAEYLREHCLVRGGLFHDMSHSGINPYLTLHLAQVLLRAGDPRFEGLVEAVAALASPTGQWPEAVHPRTGGGCMGDGQHVWAAAEWVLMLRNRFIREEQDRLVLCSGIPPRWLRKGHRVALAPAPTAFGTLALQLEPGRSRLRLRCRGEWHGPVPAMEVRLPGFETTAVRGDGGVIDLELKRSR